MGQAWARDGSPSCGAEKGSCSPQLGWLYQPSSSVWFLSCTSSTRQMCSSLSQQPGCAQFPVVRWSHATASGRTGVHCLSARGRNLHRTSMLGPCCASSPRRPRCSVLRRKAQSQQGQWPGMAVTCRWQLHMAPFGEISNQCYHHPDVHSCANGDGERRKEQGSAGS